jgi:hypothetical protein
MVNPHTYIFAVSELKNWALKNWITKRLHPSKLISKIDVLLILVDKLTVGQEVF